MTGSGGATATTPVDVGILLAPEVYTSLPVGVSVNVRFALDVDLGASILGASSVCIPFVHPLVQMSIRDYERLSLVPVSS
jgi:hypothetical protein